MSYKDGIYLVPNIYAESASLQIAEFVDKHPLAPGEDIAGFDFSHLEQWENSRLNLDLAGGKWKVSAASAKPNQNELNEWYESSWTISRHRLPSPTRQTASRILRWKSN